MKKIVLPLLLLCAVFVVAPLSTRADPIFIPIVLGALGVIDFTSCDVNIVWGCDDDDSFAGGAGGGSGGGGDTACTSGANSCGMTNTGFIQGGSCNASPPPNSQCASPVIGTEGFYASPAITGPGRSSTLNWSATEATACTITGDNGFAYSGGASGSISSGPLSESVTFSLTCQNGNGGPQSSKSLRVIVDPKWKEVDPNS